MRTTIAAIFATIYLASVSISLAAESEQIKQHVVDSAKILTDTEAGWLNAELKDFEVRTSFEINVVTIPPLDAVAKEEYIRSAKSAWAARKKVYGGSVLFLILPSATWMSIEASNNARDILTDELAASICDSIIFPSFEKGKISEGIVEGTYTIMRSLEKPTTNPAGTTTVVLVLLATIPITFLFLNLSKRWKWI